jgi:hypothetical protein
MPEPWHEVDAAMKRDDVENDQDRALRPFFDVNRVNGDIAVGKNAWRLNGQCWDAELAIARRLQAQYDMGD